MPSDVLPSEAQRAWVFRVLGVETGVSPPASRPSGGAEVPAIRARLAGTVAELKQFKAAGDPRTAALTEMMAAAALALKTDPDAAAILAAQLESGIALAKSAARGREAAALNPRGIAFPKLQLRWREAQSQASADLQILGDTLLADADIRTDPRFHEVEEFVSDLPTMLPHFGGRLEATLDALTNAGPDADAAPLTAAAIKALGEYRQQVGASTLLAQLEMFAAGQLGLKLSIFDALDRALGEIDQALRTVKAVEE